MEGSYDLSALSADVGRLLDEGLAGLQGERMPLQAESLACMLGLPLRDPFVPYAAADVIASAVARRPEPQARELLEVLATLGPRRLAAAARDELGGPPPPRPRPVPDALRAISDQQVDVVAWTCAAGDAAFLGRVVVERRGALAIVDGALDPTVPGDVHDLLDFLAPLDDDEHVSELDAAGARERVREVLAAAAGAGASCTQAFALSEALLAWCLDDVPLDWPALPAVVTAPPQPSPPAERRPAARRRRQRRGR